MNWINEGVEIKCSPEISEYKEKTLVDYGDGKLLSLVLSAAHRHYFRDPEQNTIQIKQRVLFLIQP